MLDTVPINSCIKPISYWFFYVIYYKYMYLELWNRNKHEFHFILFVLGRKIDIVTDPTFQSANQTLKGLIQTQLGEGLLKPTQHRSIISEDDLARLTEYFRYM